MTRQPPVHPSLTEVRRAVERRLSGSSRAEVAGEIGVSLRTLVNFLAGVEQLHRTTRKLVRWYLKFGARRLDVDAEMADSALAVLLDALPVGPVYQLTKDEVVHALERGHRLAKVEAPRWLRLWVEVVEDE